MRELKFRGRIVPGVENGGSWVYWGIGGTDLLDVIDPETIGQFTGRLDCNEKEIWEGDIVTINKVERTVVFSDGCFEASSPYCDGCLSYWNQKDILVIGNIHEEPPC